MIPLHSKVLYKGKAKEHGQTRHCNFHYYGLMLFVADVKDGFLFTVSSFANEVGGSTPFWGVAILCEMY